MNRTLLLSLMLERAQPRQPFIVKNTRLIQKGENAAPHEKLTSSAQGSTHQQSYSLKC